MGDDRLSASTARLNEVDSSAWLSQTLERIAAGWPNAISMRSCPGIYPATDGSRWTLNVDLHEALFVLLFEQGKRDSLGAIFGGGAVLNERGARQMQLLSVQRWSASSFGYRRLFILLRQVSFAAVDTVAGSSNRPLQKAKIPIRALVRNG
jgi:hypothetical protein